MLVIHYFRPSPLFRRAVFKTADHYFCAHRAKSPPAKSPEELSASPLGYRLPGYSLFEEPLSSLLAIVIFSCSSLRLSSEEPMSQRAGYQDHEIIYQEPFQHVLLIFV
jgi:hypothetical protein